MRILAVVSAAVMCALNARAQPTTCIDNAQCPAGYFCETAVHRCQKCLHCEDLKREGPVLPSSTSCIKSVVECGSCLQGLVVDRRGNVDGPCVPPDETAESSLPVYIWGIIILAIVGFFIALIIVVISVLRRKDLFRISTATWLRSCPSNRNASAPEPPPPYNPYAPVRPESPFAMSDLSSPLTEEETSWPFIKRAPQSHPVSTREAEGNQNALGYNPPHYVRVHPSSPINADENSNNCPSIHSDDTMPHGWTPNASVNANDDNGNTGNTVVSVSAAENSQSTESVATNLPALLAAARETELVSPPAKKLRTQDASNNMNRGASSSDDERTGDGAGPSPASAQATALYINVQINNNAQL